MGFWSTKEISTAISVVNLVEPNVADPTAMIQSLVASKGDLNAFAKAYLVGFRPTYRKRFSKEQLSRYGFNPLTASNVSIDMTPIIPIRESNQFVAAEGSVERDNTKYLLKRLGIGAQEIYDELENNADIDNAYIMMGVYPGTENQGATAALFKTFEYYYEQGISHLEIGISKMATSYDFKVSKTTHSGHIADIGHYEKTISQGEMEQTPEELEAINEEYAEGLGSMADRFGITAKLTFRDVMIIKYQKTENQYIQIKVTKFKQRWTIVTKGKFYHFGGRLYYPPQDEDGPTKSRIILPLKVFNSMRYKDWLGGYEYGLSMMCYAYQETKLKIWQTGIFRIVIIIVITYITWGAGTPMTLAAFATQVAINIAISFVMSELLMSIDNDVIKIIAILALAIFTAGGGLNFDINTLLNFDNFLPMIQKFAEAYNEIQNIQLKSELEKIQEEIDDEEEQAKMYEQLLEDITGLDLDFTSTRYSSNLSGESPGGMISPDTFIEQSLGSNVYNVDACFDVDFAYSSRKNVKSG